MNKKYQSLNRNKHRKPEDFDQFCGSNFFVDSVPTIKPTTKAGETISKLMFEVSDSKAKMSQLEFEVNDTTAKMLDDRACQKRWYNKFHSREIRDEKQAAKLENAEQIDGPVSKAKKKRSNCSKILI